MKPAAYVTVRFNCARPIEMSFMGNVDTVILKMEKAAKH